MPTLEIGEAKLFWQEAGRGRPIVLVHGSWGDAENWAAVVPGLARRFRVISYDRRGHSRSSAPARQGSFAEDADDLAALIERLDLAPAFVAGNSGGALITLRLAAKRPDLLCGLTAHEPPGLLLLAGQEVNQKLIEGFQQRAGKVVALLEQGRDAEAAETFVETIALGPGNWARIPPQLQQTFIRNAPTFLDETRDREGLWLDLAALRRYPKPALLTRGDQSPPMFAPILDQVAAALPQARRHTFAGAGHVPHVTHPEQWVELVSAAAAAAHGS